MVGQMSAHAKIHIGLKVLGIAGEDARDLYERVTGARSLRAMSPPQHKAVVDELHRLGFNPASKGPAARRASGPYAAKLQALWIGAYNLGVARNGSDEAMMAFVRRQTGLDHTRFMRFPEDAEKAIEAIKGWVRRETGNDGLYRREQNRLPILNDFRFQLLVTQWSRLRLLDAAPAATMEVWAAAKVSGKSWADYSQGEWIDLMNALGRLLREALAGRKARS
jgi:hypothetical protein